MKKPIYKRKSVWVAAALLAAAAVFFILDPWNILPSPTVSGEAEAVTTTKVKVYDGIWDPKRYSDEFYIPSGLAFLGEHLVVADTMCDRVQIIDGERNKRVGLPGQYGLSYLDSGALVDGYRENALFMKPADVAVCPNGDIIVCDTGNHVIRKITDEFVVTVAGDGKSGYQDGKEGAARFNAPRSAAVDADGFIYVADTMNHCIRLVSPEGDVSLYAGTPGESGYRDGALLEARFYEPAGIFLSPGGELFVADSANHCVRKIAGGAVATVAGTPGETDANTGYPQGGYIDGEREAARFNFPKDIIALPDGSVAVADSMNHAIRLIAGGYVRTLAGSGMADQFYGSAENLKLTRPEGVCADGEFLYISDTMNNRVVALPLTERIREGRPSRDAMLRETDVSTTSKYAYNGDIRVYVGGQRIDMGRVQPWNTEEHIYVPIRPLFEALGAGVNLDEKTNALAVTILEQDTVLNLNRDYFILKGIAVTTLDEIVRLFPYTVEWFPEFSLIALCIPSDLEAAGRQEVIP